MEIRSEGRSLAIYESGQRRGTVPLALLERVIVTGRQIKLDSGVLTQFAENAVSTVFVSARRSRQVAVVLGPQHNDASVRMAQTQRALDPEYCLKFSTALVRVKIERQEKLLRDAMTRRPDCLLVLTKNADTLRNIIERIHLREFIQLDELRGYEGAGARSYFSAFTSLFAASLGFTGRNRRPPRDPVNACLSLGYTLLHHEAVRAAYMAGLDPLIGFYHRPSIGRESLASDLIEPLRPLVDEWVWELFRSDKLRKSHFTNEGNGCWLGKAGREHFYSEWEHNARLPRRWLRQQCRLLAREFRQIGLQWLELESEDEKDVD